MDTDRDALTIGHSLLENCVKGRTAFAWPSRTILRVFLKSSGYKLSENALKSKHLSKFGVSRDQNKKVFQNPFGSYLYHKISSFRNFEVQVILELHQLQNL